MYFWVKSQRPLDSRGDFNTVLEPSDKIGDRGQAEAAKRKAHPLANESPPGGYFDSYSLLQPCRAPPIDCPVHVAPYESPLGEHRRDSGTKC